MATLYRVVKTDPPTTEDFLSHRERGIPLQKNTPELRRSWEGVSATTTLEAAHSLAALFPRMGSFVAVLEIDPDGPVRFERTLASPTHYDIWGEPRNLLAAVVEVVPV